MKSINETRDKLRKSNKKKTINEYRLTDKINWLKIIQY